MESVLARAQSLCVFALLCVVVALGKLVPAVKRFAVRKFVESEKNTTAVGLQKMYAEHIPLEVFAERTFSDFAAVRAMWFSSRMQRECRVHEGGPAVNAALVDSAGKALSLFSLCQNRTRPLVINFGSCT
jgi:hypothetical protein